jgi:hypothetical protein
VKKLLYNTVPTLLLNLWVKKVVFWDVTVCNVVEVYQWLEMNMLPVHLDHRVAEEKAMTRQSKTLKIEVVHTCKTLVEFHQTALDCVP